MTGFSEAVSRTASAWTSKRRAAPARRRERCVPNPHGRILFMSELYRIVEDIDERPIRTPAIPQIGCALSLRELRDLVELLPARK